MIQVQSPRFASPLLGGVFAVLLLLGAATSCASSSASDAASPRTGIAGSWDLQRLPDAPLLDLAAGARVPSLEIESDGAVSGFGGVNRFHGRYDAAALAEGRLERAEAMITTRMAGSPDAMAVEEAFLTALGDADGYRIEGVTLVLTRAGSPVAHLARGF